MLLEFHSQIDMIGSLGDLFSELLEWSATHFMLAVSAAERIREEYKTHIECVAEVADEKLCVKLVLMFLLL